MALIRSTVFFAAGVAVGAFGRDALPKLREKFPQIAEQLDPVLSAAVNGARDAAGDAYAQVARQVSEVVGTFQGTTGCSQEPRSESARPNSSAA